MDKSKIKEILIKAIDGDAKAFKVSSYKREYRYLKRQAHKKREGLLFDNFYLLEEAVSAVGRVRISKRLRYYTSLLFPFLNPNELSSALSAFFEVLSDTLTSEEFERVPNALFGECILSVAKGNELALEIIRALQGFDFSPFMLGFLKYEQLLRKDIVYNKLDRDTKALYKKKIEAYSKKRGLSFGEGCERLVEEASKNKCHIGELLPFSRGESGWLALPVIIFSLLFFSFLFFISDQLPIPLMVLVSLLVICPLWHSSFELFVPIVAKFRNSEILPRLDVPKITKECSTLTVITALAGDTKEVERLFSHLELLSLKTKSRGKDEYAFWGVLLDLPESKSLFDAKDRSVIEKAKSEVERLNSIYGAHFVLFTRQRVWDEKTGAYTSHERKRGAIIELVKLLDEKESALDFFGVQLPEIKYVLTLDSDTDMELGALNKLVGTMLHPLNRPVVKKRYGTNVVVSGFGILQPVSISTIESTHKTRFSSLISGIGGTNSYHSSIFNLNDVIFGRGIFCGKGMFDVSAFSQTLLDAFPDGIVLSHDILEGSRLRVGYMSDVCFFDSVPTNAISFYSRAHRWIRGDVQALAFISDKIKTPYGIVKNPMLAGERFIFITNFLNALTPVCQILGLLFLMWFDIERHNTEVLFFLLPCFSPLLNELLRTSFRGSFLNVLRRFFGDTLTGLCREIIMLGYRLSSLALVAYRNADAVIRSVWRMKVSGKKLLEWKTASQFEAVSSGSINMFIFALPSFALGVFMLAFAKPGICRLLGILWCAFFIILEKLSKPVAVKEISEEKKKKIRGYALDIWKYFQRYADASNNYLPPDNVAVFPSSEVACRTSPTNIGLYLASILAALDFSFISLDEAITRFENCLTSIEKMKKYKGQLYNWYSTVTLEPIGQEYISTVDCGNFITFLVAVYEGLREYEKNDKRIVSIRQRLKIIEVNSDFRFLFNQSRNLFSLGFFVDGERQDRIVYDMYMSEARTTDYYAVARGIVRDSHWSALSRPLVTTLGGIGALSWSGTAFEYFMPQLLLPTYKNSFAYEALNFSFWEQVGFSGTVKHERIFGISESGYFAFDEALNYQYRAFGVPILSRRVERDEQKVISPYSSFLMLRISPSLVLKNLEVMKKLGMYGEFGFYEAIDLSVSRVEENGAIVKSFMSHHLGMSLVACANAVFDDVFIRRFMSDKELCAVSELLKESVPADAKGIKKERLQKPIGERKRSISVKGESSFRNDVGAWALTGRDSSATFFERGVLSLNVTTGKGESISALRPVDRTNSNALFLFSRVGEHISSPSISPDVSYSFSASSAEYKQGELFATISLSASYNATRVRLEAAGDEGEVGMYFEPVLNAITSFFSHPAFSNIFFKAEYSDDALILTRSGEKPFSLAVVSNNKFKFIVSKESLFDGKERNPSSLISSRASKLSELSETAIVSPCVFVTSDFKARTDTTFVVGWGKTRSEALVNAREELATPYARSDKKSRELFYSAVTASGGDFFAESFEKELFVFRPDIHNFYNSQMPEIYDKSSVYSLGISGELPVFLVKLNVSREALKKLLLSHKLHYVMGLRYELLIEVNDNGYMRGGRGELEALIDEANCTFLLGRSGGIHLVDINVFSGEMLNSLADVIEPNTKRWTKFQYYELLSDKDERKLNTTDGILITEKPPVLWSHVIASSTFGTIISHRNLGNTWVYNSRLSRITYWENDSVGGERSEKLIFEKNGTKRDLCASAFATHFSWGTGEYVGDRFKIKVAIHPTLMFKAVSVNVEDKDYSLIYSFLPVLDDYIHSSTKVEFFADSKNSVLFRNLFSDSMTRGFGYMMTPFEKELRLNDVGIGVHCERGGEALFILGYAKSEEHYKTVKEYFSRNRFSDLYALSKNNVFKLLKNEKLPMISYQVLVSRFWARSGPYQSGGAWGFRDQAQDCLALLDFSPELVRAHIARMASHQYKEGDVQHWWHSRRGVRTRCSDDYLWLVWLTCVYILKTKDKSILGVKVKYLVSKPLSTFEKDRYEVPDKTDESFEIIDHMRTALDLLVSRGVGDHSLPFILSGDWNDGMNMLPEGSESVWLAFFARIVIKLYSTVTGDDTYDSFSRILRDGIEKCAFFSDRYARAFLPNGEVLGVEGSRYFEIDSLPQSFACICHALNKDGNVDRISLSLDSAWKELYDEKAGIFKLFTPPLNTFDNKIGYLSAYPCGIRENGGQYTHAAVWFALALLSSPEDNVRNRERAELLAELLNPESHNTQVYKREPYVLAGDVYSTGCGGWSWYTGSANWYRDLILRLSDENRNKKAPLT